MLILSRRVGESLAIGEKIKVRILEVKGDVVKVGIEAPREIPVHRQEIYEAIEKENLAAAQVKKDVFSSLHEQFSLSPQEDES
ncbi:carbon storage regulator CsrA [Candidatus Contubernalis alkaliaceticus]|uniref:carbon storage regulator CsrA n=1 Tax=Candidatus Contubernalis alkaliaceticus TaxID=338645 RepID=UPI001F4BE138|nr:carbon storage regulator CsrA [Candidatus Contubernalis alkalaceticus]UNC91722.1 carbon storage regulator CsrA [Candidatus Contubernalis alkalaceticus]